MNRDSESEVFTPLEIKKEDYDDDEEEVEMASLPVFTPLAIKKEDYDEDEEVVMASLPEKSMKLYRTTYDFFMKWRKEKKIKSFSQSVFLKYFTELSTKYKSSSLWSHYSMIRSTVHINHGINIESFTKLRALLKKKSEGFQPKKVGTFSSENINNFLNQASDERYLAIKVAIIMGVTGACRSKEMYRMKLNDLEDLDSAYLVSVSNTENKITRKFTVAGNYYRICKKYIDSRPSRVTSDVFFLNYHNGKCQAQRMGINKFTNIGKEMALFLKLPNPERYSGHSLRRTSATLLVNPGGDINIFKWNNDLKSRAVLEDCKDITMETEMDTANEVSSSSSIQINNC